MEYSRKLFLWVFVVWLIMLLGGWCDGCLQQEKDALLQLKSFFYTIDDLHNWGEGEEFGDCCEWERVECNPTTGRVIHLFLNQSSTFMPANDDFSYYSGYYDWAIELDDSYWEQSYDDRDEWYLNASMFLPFQELKSLYLGGNYIAGCLHSQGFERLSLTLDKLEILDLSNNQLDDSILSSLSELSSLKFLYLGDNQFKGLDATMNGIKQLSKLDKLETLDLHWNYVLGNNILSQLDGFISLKTLYLQNCGLRGTVHMQEFSNLINLKELYLSDNEIRALESFQGEGETLLIKLEVLDLSYNPLDDGIFSSLGVLSNLKSLYLSSNQLTEPIDFKELGLIDLEVLDLSWSSFSSNILPYIGRLSNLKSLYFGGNLALDGPIDIRELDALGNLEKLQIVCEVAVADCSLQLQSLSMLPTSLKDLRLIGFSFNGTMTQKLGLINLEVLDLRWNSFSSNILPYLGRLSNLKSLSFRDNDLMNGSIDIKDFYALGKLEKLNMRCDSESSFWGPKVAVADCSLQLQSLSMLPTSLKDLRLIGFTFNGTMTQNKERRLGLSNLELLYLISGNNLFHNDNSILSLLGSLSNLKTLAFGGNFNGSIDMRELDALSNLEKLSIVCDSEFSTWKACSLSLQSSFGLFPSLKTFVAYGVTFDGTMTIQKWQNLTSLEELYFNGPLHLKNLDTLVIGNTLMENNFVQTIGAMSSLKYLSIWESLNGSLVTPGFCELTHLRVLDISYNNLKGVLPECFSNLTSLKFLSLYSNQLSGNISALKSLTSLQSLDLSSNQFSGNISALKSLTSLQSLDLSSNQFSGDISALQMLTFLQNLRLSNNYFQIPISLGPLFNLSKLKRIYADNNTIYAETKMPSLHPRFQLEYVSLSCCGYGGSFPQFLYHQNELRSVHLSNIYFKGEFPNWLLENNTKLDTLVLANNSLFGELRLPFLPHADLSYFDISVNYFYGDIPIEIGAKLPSLRSLNMSRNHFRGSIPVSIGDMKFLQQLDLSNNRLIGGLPKHLAVGCSALYVLILSNNGLEGQMFPSNFNLTNLKVLQLDGNNFTGSIPDCLSNCSGLSTLDFSKNQLYGRIPSWMGNLSSLEEIVMANNHLEGQISVEFCQLNLQLKLLDLSLNNLSGSIPSCFSPLWISQVHLSRNKLQGPLNDALRNSTILVTLDLSNNHLTGNIPNWIGNNLSQLSYLLLNNNHFEGKIPVELCELNHLSLIDLSHNNLSGSIPPCLKITTLNDVSEDYVRYVADVAQAPSSFSTDEPVQFSMRNSSYSYKGRVLRYLSGIDLSCNKLTGQIPLDVHNFEKIVVLNLSHNSLMGPIPPTISNLRQIESLDLSYNNLSGIIPPQLVGLTYLAWFSVAYNNLSGKTPLRTAQFSTFEAGSYLGNPLLCGPPLPKNCSPDGPSPSMPKDSSEDEDGSIDMNVFYVSFGVTYVVVLLAIACVLYINPYWRQAWFYNVETVTTSCYYFVIDNLPKPCRC